MNKSLVTLLLLASTTAYATLPAPGTPGAPNDLRYCGEPARYADGRIKRSTTVLKNFVAVFPCPANLQNTTSCPGWILDHIIPRADGGCDAVINLQWLPTVEASDKDRWERVYHAIPRQAVPPAKPASAPRRARR